MQPKTVLKWYQRGFRLWWRWKSRGIGGRPPIRPEMRALIRQLSRENLLWSAERIHGHLRLLGFDPPGPDTIRKYMVKPEGGTEKSQNWLTFLRNHTGVSWGMDFFTVPTIRFQILYVVRGPPSCPSSGGTRSRDGSPHDGSGDPATARGDALWPPAHLPIPG